MKEKSILFVAVMELYIPVSVNFTKPNAREGLLLEYVQVKEGLAITLNQLIRSLLVINRRFRLDGKSRNHLQQLTVNNIFHNYA